MGCHCPVPTLPSFFSERDYAQNPLPEGKMSEIALVSQELWRPQVLDLSVAVDEVQN